MRVNFFETKSMVMENLSPNMGKSMKVDGRTTGVPNYYAGNYFLY